MSIQLSVGTGGFNFLQDTCIVQSLLNDHLAGNGVYRARFDQEVTMSGQLLVVDGLCGPLTETAIRMFQIVVMKKPESRADGRVDPPRGTWRGTWHALNGTVDLCDAPQMYLTPKLEGAVGASMGTTQGYGMFRQGDFKGELGHRYDSDRDGDVDVFDQFSTIARAGCCLCTLTMAATSIGHRTPPHWPEGLQSKDLAPDVANRIMHAGGAYGPGGLDMPLACTLLGMRGEHRGYGSSHIPVDGVQQIRQHLALGRPIAAHVDYKDKRRKGAKVIHTKGDHWVLITGTGPDPVRQFTAIDPAVGGKMYFTSNGTLHQRVLELQAAQIQAELTGDELILRPAALYGIAGNSYANQNRYMVVRFMLLHPA